MSFTAATERKCLRDQPYVASTVANCWYDVRYHRLGIIIFTDNSSCTDASLSPIIMENEINFDKEWENARVTERPCMWQKERKRVANSVLLLVKEASAKFYSVRYLFSIILHMLQNYAMT